MGLWEQLDASAWGRELNRLEGLSTGNLPQWTVQETYCTLAPSVNLRHEHGWLGATVAHDYARDRYLFYNPPAGLALESLRGRPVLLRDVVAGVPPDQAESGRDFLSRQIEGGVVVAGSWSHCRRLARQAHPGPRAVVNAPYPGAPLWATVYLSRRCNLSCGYCNVDAGRSPEEELPASSWSDILGQLARAGVTRVTVDGGEPTMHPGFCAILADLAALPLSVTVVTNATLLGAPELDIISGAANIHLMVGLDAARADRHDAARGCAGAFDRTAAALDAFAGRGFNRVSILTVVHGGNLDGLDEVARFAADRGFEGVHYLLATPAGRGRGFPHLLTPDQAGAAVAALRELADRVKNRLVVRIQGRGPWLKPAAPGASAASGPCLAGTVQLCIAPDGEVYPCEVCMMVPAGERGRFAVGRLTGQSLAAIWSGPGLEPWRRSRPPVSCYCRTCRLFEACCIKKCGIYAFAASGREGVPPPECRHPG